MEEVEGSMFVEHLTADSGRTPRPLLFRGDGAFLFLHGSGAFADALAQVGQFGAANLSSAFDFDLLDPGRMQGENAFDAFTIADPAHGKGGIQTAPTAANDNAREDLDAFLVAFDDFGVHADGIADVEVRGLFAELF